MPSKNIKTRTEVLQKFNLTQSDIVRVFNDDECALDGLADNNETFRLFVIKKNGTEILLGDMPPDAIFSIRFRSIKFEPETDSYSYIDITSASPPIEARGGVVVGGNAKNQQIYNEKFNDGAIIGGEAKVRLKHNSPCASLFMWGNNSHGQLGDGTTINRYNFQAIGGKQNLLHVSTGESHTVAIDSYGDLYSWGNNEHGQLGDGTNLDKYTPVKMQPMTDWDSTSAGANHTIAINSDKELYAWGNNADGQLGDGATTSRSTPARIGTANNWAKISAGSNHTVAINSDGELYAWGDNADSQLGDGTTVNSNTPTRIGTANNWLFIGAGFNHTVAINSDGELYAWGNNSYGQLGDGTTTNKSIPTRIGNETNWSVVSSRYSHTVAINSDGELYVWGDNSEGQLGDGTYDNKNNPILISIQDIKWSSAYSGAHYTIAVTSEGYLYSWGKNSEGQLGNGTNVSTNFPALISGIEANNLFDISAGIYGHIVFLPCGFSPPYDPDTYGCARLYVWGRNVFGQLGEDATDTGEIPPTPLGDNPYWTNIAVGSYHTLGTDLLGRLYSWGNNSDGQLGDGTTTSRSTPTRIGNKTAWSNVKVGLIHTIGMIIIRTPFNIYTYLYTWGNNDYGQLGDATNTGSPVPVMIKDPKFWSTSSNDTFSAGLLHSAAISRSGDLYTWGYNGFGQLGDGTNTNRNAPTKIITTGRWSSVYAGSNHTVGIKSGSLYAWGRNNFGQLGDGTNTNRSTIVRIGNDNNWKTASSGQMFTLAINLNGELYAWGLNHVGQLGDGTNENKNTPVRIGNKNDWVRVVAGDSISFAINNLGELYSWGANFTGELGDGTTIGRNVPTKVGNLRWKQVSGWTNSAAGIVRC